MDKPDIINKLEFQQLNDLQAVLDIRKYVNYLEDQVTRSAKVVEAAGKINFEWLLAYMFGVTQLDPHNPGREEAAKRLEDLKWEIDELSKRKGE